MRIAFLIAAFLIFCCSVFPQEKWIGKYKVEHSKKAKDNYSEIEIDSSDNSPERMGEYGWIFKAYQRDTLVWYATGHGFVSNGMLKMYPRSFTAITKLYEKNRKYFRSMNQPLYEVVNENDAFFIQTPKKRNRKLRLVPIK